jgi:ribosome-binding factor A
MKLRIIPELRFVRDHSAEQGAHMAQLLRSIAKDTKEDGEASDEE